MNRTRESLPRRIRLVSEFAALFVGIPVLWVTWFRGSSPLPILIAVTLATTLWMLRRGGFAPEHFFRLPGRPGWARLAAVRFVVIAAGLVAFVVMTEPFSLFSFPRRNPVAWAVVMLAYPALSAYPQEILYRGFLMRRYAPLFPAEYVMRFVSAAAFGFSHIIYGSVLSVLISGVGGLIFADSYRRTGSLLAAAMEHALYGGLIFTIGLGPLFYHGALGP